MDTSSFLVLAMFMGGLMGAAMGLFPQDARLSQNREHRLFMFDCCRVDIGFYCRISCNTWFHYLYC